MPTFFCFFVDAPKARFFEGEPAWESSVCAFASDLASPSNLRRDCVFCGGGVEFRGKTVWYCAIMAKKVVVSKERRIQKEW